MKHRGSTEECQVYDLIPTIYMDTPTSRNESNTFIQYTNAHTPHYTHIQTHTCPHTCALSLAYYVTPSESLSHAFCHSRTYVSVCIYIHMYTAHKLRLPFIFDPTDMSAARLTSVWHAWPSCLTPSQAGGSRA